MIYLIGGILVSIILILTMELRFQMRMVANRESWLEAKEEAKKKQAELYLKQIYDLQIQVSRLKEKQRYFID